MHCPSMFLGILSARYVPVLLVKMSFPVRYCCCLIYEVLFLLRDGQLCIRTKSVADLILPRGCSLSHPLFLLLTCPKGLPFHLFPITSHS